MGRWVCMGGREGGWMYRWVGRRWIVDRWMDWRIDGWVDRWILMDGWMCVW